MAPKIDVSRLKDLAETGALKDVENLLRAYGDAGTSNPKYSCLDAIAAGASATFNRGSRDDKRALIAAYVAKTGVFAEKGDTVPADAAAQIQETLIQLLETVQELTEKISDLNGQVDGLQKEIKGLKKDVVKPARPSAYPSVH